MNQHARSKAQKRFTIDFAGLPWVVNVNSPYCLAVFKGISKMQKVLKCMIFFFYDLLILSVILKHKQAIYSEKISRVGFNSLLADAVYLFDDEI